MKLACQEHLLPGESILEKWEFAASAGFDGIELRGTDDWRGRLDDLRAAREEGVVFSSVCLVSDRFIGDFDAERRREAIEHMKHLLSGIAELGGKGAITPAAFGLASKRLPLSRCPARKKRSTRAARRPGGAGRTRRRTRARSVLLEPLNRYEDHMLNRVEQAVELCEAVGRPSIKVMGDLFHMNIEEDDLGEAIRRAEGHLAHIHLADSNRLQPGAGHTDFAGAFGALRDIGFDGYMAMECGIRGDTREVLPEVVRGLRSWMG